ncbi:myosin light chain kinase family member 4 [Anabrus simplex]|uniref:myosin light chain kinase family member 4 n=1 Tax=Anabrus simplex TaxID=316456 RepID=UPI0035A3539C
MSCLTERRNVPWAALFSDKVRPEVRLQPMVDFRRRYEVLEILGAGRYGIVRRVKERISGKEFAAKFMRCKETTDFDKVRDEVEMLNQLRHKRIVQLFAAYEGPREVVMVTQYLSGGEVTERVGAPESECAYMIRQVCEALRYIHRIPVVHLDLKPENIMCMSRDTNDVMLIDFGVARALSSEVPVRMLFGTPEFVPPEVIAREPVGTDCDMWAVGVVAFILLSGLSPFLGDDDADTFANVVKLDYDFQDEAFDGVSEDAKDFISRLLVRRKDGRMTAKECLQHRWLTRRQDNS